MSRSGIDGENSAERVFVGMGSNLGPRLSHLKEGLRALKVRGILILSISSLYDTDPIGYLDQGNFLNLVAETRWSGPPRDFLEQCQAVEKMMGRTPSVKDGPRTLDIDLLLFGDRIHREPGLEIPHPRLHERRFVLVPLEEIAPEIRHPTLGLTIRALLQRCPDRSGVRKLRSRLALEREDSPGYNPAASRGKME